MNFILQLLEDFVEFNVPDGTVSAPEVKEGNQI